MATEEYGIAAVETSTDILDGLRQLDKPTLSELADHLGMAVSTVHIHLKTLEDANYVVREDGQYELSLRFLEYGLHTRNKTRLYQQAKYHVDELAQESGELANLMVEEQGKGRYLYSQKEESAVYFEEAPGHHAPLHSTALGKAILAEYPRDRVEEILEKAGMPRETPHTITEIDELHEELSTIREEGIAHDREEYNEGIRCAAVSILTEDGVEGAISISGPVNRMNTPAFQEKVRDLLLDAKNVIELGLTPYDDST